jgi:hypothetical protein
MNYQVRLMEGRIMAPPGRFPPSPLGYGGTGKLKLKWGEALECGVFSSALGEVT